MVMKKLLLAAAVLALAAPALAGTGGNPKPKDHAPDTKSHWGGDHSQPVVAAPAQKPADKR